MTGRERRLQLWGWVLFVVSALFYIAAGIRTGDMLALIGALVFLVACAFFIFAFVGSPE